MVRPDLDTVACVNPEYQLFLWFVLNHGGSTPDNVAQIPPWRTASRHDPDALAHASATMDCKIVRTALPSIVVRMLPLTQAGEAAPPAARPARIPKGAGLSTAASAQGREEGLGVLEIRGVAAFGEPAIDVGQ
jgi:hypothetical protein